jgi:hypothetical protein
MLAQDGLMLNFGGLVETVKRRPFGFAQDKQAAARRPGRDDRFGGKRRWSKDRPLQRQE